MKFPHSLWGNTVISFSLLMSLTHFKLFRDLYAWDEKISNEIGQKSAARKIALETFEKAKNSYMHVAVKKLEKILKIENHGE